MTKLREELRESESFLANVGRCITSWAQIEEKLFDLCVIALKAPKKQTAIVYYKTPTIDSRLALVDELITAALPKKKSGDHSTGAERLWDGITTEFRKLLPERNALAHFPLKTVWSIYALMDPSRDDARKLSMRPHRNERLRGKEHKVQRMDAEHLPVHLERVKDLESQMFQFKSILRYAIRKKRS